MNIFVAQLSFRVQSENLKEIFEAYGEVTSAKVITDKTSGRSKGFGFVEMETEEQEELAIKECNRCVVAGRSIVVSKAHARKGYEPK